jgi:hypothetical protein
MHITHLILPKKQQKLLKMCMLVSNVVFGLTARHK